MELEITAEEAETAIEALRRVGDLPASPFAAEARSALRKLDFDLDLTALGESPVVYADPEDRAADAMMSGTMDRAGKQDDARTPSPPVPHDAHVAEGRRFYNHQCQVCLHDFEPRYGVAYADTRILPGLEEAALPRSRDLLVVCPNHDVIIGAANASFDRRSLAFEYPNGLVEKVRLRDHLLTV